MKNILITGATGNVGISVIEALWPHANQINLIAGVRDPDSKDEKPDSFKIKRVKFDFTDNTTFNNAFKQVDILFLLRPPQISDVKNIFEPLILAAMESKIQHIIFLSVQGVERSSIIPHHKIEKLIVDSKIPFTFLRPAYFMQNFTTTLRNDLAKNHRIFLPAGKAIFTLVDVRDIGKTAAAIILDSGSHINKKYELTSSEKYNFAGMAVKLSDGLGVPINYESPNLLRFFWVKRKEKMPVPLILVMIMLHYLPRFQKVPENTEWVMKLTGNQPILFEKFIADNKEIILNNK